MTPEGASRRGGAKLAISLFGGLRSQADEHTLRLPSSARARSLLAFLALQQGQPQRRDYLAFTLWPDSTEEQARTNLRQALFGLTLLPPLASVLLATRATIEFGEAASVDVRRFAEMAKGSPAAARSVELSADALDRLAEGAALYQGDLLPELSDDWFQLPRERFRREVGSILAVLVTGYRQRGDLRSALAHAERLASLDSLDEESQRLLIDLQWRSGRIDLARVTFDRLIARLRSELGVASDPETEALGRRIQRRPDAPQRELHILRSPPPGLAFARADSPFVGRTAERAALAEAWAHALDGRGQIAVITGVAGIGKSRLVQEAVLELDPPPDALAPGRARAPGGPPFGPLVEAVRRVLAQRSPTTWPVLPRPWAQAIANFLPEMAQVDEPTEPRRQLVLDAWSVLLHNLGDRLVLAVDDLPWADEATLSLLDELVHKLPDAAMLILVTARSSDLGPDTPAGALLNRADRLGVLVRLELGPLSPEHSQGLVRTVGRGLPDAVADAVTQRADGNPLFLVELAGAARSTSEAAERTELPASVRALVTEQVRRAPAEAQTAVAAMSVLGTAHPSLLAAVLGWPDERVAAATSAAFQRQLLVETASDGTLGFSHDVLREAVGGSLDPPELRLWHRRAAAALAGLADPDAAGAADHYQAAGEEANALPFILLAAETDLRRATPEVAVPRFERGLDIARRLNRYVEIHRASHGLARAQLGVGNVDAAAAAFESARLAARMEGDRGAELEALAGLVEVAVARDRIPDGLRLFRQMLALPVTPGDAVAERALVRASMGSMVLFGLQRPLVEEGRAHLRSGLQLAERLGDAHSARVLQSDLVDLTSHVEGPWPAALRDHQRLDDHFCAAWLLIWMGQARLAVAEANLAIALARQAADYSAVANAQVFLGTALGLQGDYVSGFDLLEQAPLAAAAYSQQTRLWQTGFRIVLARELELWPLVMSDAEQHVELAAAMGGIEAPFQGLVEAARWQARAHQGGDPWEAMEHLRERAETLRHPVYTVDRLAARLAEADLALSAGDPVRASRVADRVSEIAQPLGAARELAHAARIRALAAGRLGQTVRAESALAEARAMATEVGEPTLRWKILAAEAALNPAPDSQRALWTAAEGIRSQLPRHLQSMFEAEDLAARRVGDNGGPGRRPTLP